MCRNRNAKYGSRLNKVAATIWKPYTLEKYTRKQINLWFTKSKAIDSNANPTIKCMQCNANKTPHLLPHIYE